MSRVRVPSPTPFFCPHSRRKRVVFDRNRQNLIFPNSVTGITEELRKTSPPPSLWTQAFCFSRDKRAYCSEFNMNFSSCLSSITPHFRIMWLHNFRMSPGEDNYTDRGHLLHDGRDVLPCFIEIWLLFRVQTFDLSKWNWLMPERAWAHDAQW